MGSLKKWMCGEKRVGGNSGDHHQATGNRKGSRRVGRQVREGFTEAGS